MRKNASWSFGSLSIQLVVCIKGDTLCKEGTRRVWCRPVAPSSPRRSGGGRQRFDHLPYEHPIFPLASPFLSPATLARSNFRPFVKSKSRLDLVCSSLRHPQMAPRKEKTEKLSAEEAADKVLRYLSELESSVNRLLQANRRD